MTFVDTILFGTYLVSVGAIGYNLIRAKLQDDWEEEIKKLREYDLSTEQIKTAVDKLDDGEFIVLADHKAIVNAVEEGGEENLAGVPKPLFSQTIPYANLLDPTRFFKVSTTTTVLDYHNTHVIYRQNWQSRQRSQWQLTNPSKKLPST